MLMCLQYCRSCRGLQGCDDDDTRVVQRVKNLCQSFQGCKDSERCRSGGGCRLQGICKPGRSVSIYRRRPLGALAAEIPHRHLSRDLLGVV